MPRPKSMHRYSYKPLHRAKPGTRDVYVEDTIGGVDCWCGERSDHDWPGRSDGEPHPRERRSK